MMMNLMTVLAKKVFISSKPSIVCLLCPPPCGPFSIQEIAVGGLSYKVKNAGFPFRKILQIRKAFYEIIQFGKLPLCTSITVRYPVPMPTQSIDPPDLP
ncbi:hypothetical protein, partial [Gallintestinimicrobium sp.]|uniref:hypothetical protein n=1 Tax=Gallintestinimicrobium sp. TaxID=2981655 RepID=UPI003AF64C29